MRYTTLAVCGAAAFLVVGCQIESSLSGSEDASSAVALTPFPASPAAEDTFTLGVTAHNDQSMIRTVAVDFEDDGTMDATQPFNMHNVSTAFTHVYPASGTYSLRATVTDAGGKRTSRTMEVTVAEPGPTIPVRFEVYGSSPQDGRCYAMGPPVTCPNCNVLVGTSTPLPFSMSLGDQHHGAQVSVDQGFNQWPIVFNNVQYQCEFHVHVFAGPPGQERPIGNGACSTTSFTMPAIRNCRIAVKVKVP